MADRSAKLNIEITASGSKAKAEIQGVENAVKKLGSSATGFQQGFKGAASTASNFAGIFTGDKLTGATSQLTSLAGAVGAIPGPLGLATGAAAGFVAAGAGVGAMLFKLANDASEYGSRIHDASVQTGLGAETLSALDIAAKQSGTSLEQMTSGLAKFDKTVGAAIQGSKEAAANLKALGIDPQAALKDLDGSLDKVFQRIGRAKPGIEQTTLAQKAFGKAGADLIPLMEQAGWNLDEFRSKMKALGLTIDNDAMNKADEFGDQMVILEEQLKHVGYAIGMELMPVFKDMASYTSDWLSQNKGEIASWGTYTADILRGIAAYWRDIGKAMDESRAFGQSPFSSGAFPRGILGGVGGYGLFGLLGRGADALSERGAQDRPPEVYGPYLPPGAKSPDDSSFPKPPGKGGSTKKAKLDIPELGSMNTLVISSGHPDWDAWFVEMGAKFHVDPNVLLLQANRESGGRANARSPKGAQGFSQFMPGTAARFNVNTSSIKDSIRGQAQYMAVLLSMFGGDYKKALAGYNAGEGNVQKYGGVPPFRETQGYVSGIASAYAAKVRKGKGGYGTYNEEDDDQKKAEAAAKRKVELARATSEALIHFDELYYQAARENADSDESLRIAQEIHDEKVKMAEDEVAEAKRVAKAQVEGSEEAEKANHEWDLAVIKTNIDIADADAELARKQKEIQDDELKRLDDILDRMKDKLKALDEEKKKQAELAADEEEYANARAKAFDLEKAGAFGRGLFDTIGGSKFESQADMMTSSLQRLGEIGGQAILGLSDAMGSLVENWILYGAVGENAAQKAVASVLAMAAKQSFSLMIMETAYGIAALTPWGAAIYGSAANHFKSAALFGIVAAGTAGLGRAVAGDSFKQGKASGSAGGYGSGSVNSDPSTYSRVSEGAYRSGTNNHMYALLNRSINSLRDKITSMRPGDVLVRGANERRGFIGEQTVRDVRANSGTGKNLGRAMGIS